MESVVYVDVLLVINLVINYLLLLGSGRLAGRRIQGIRLVVASLFGSFSSLVIFFPYLDLASNLFFKAAVSVVMVLIAFPYEGILRCLRDVFILFSVSFIFAGSMLAVWIFLSPSKMLYYNGVVYFHFNAITLIGMTTGCYFAVEVLSRIYHRRRGKGEICRLIIGCLGKTAETKALVDNGNVLSEPFSDTPVIVCCEQAIASVVPPEIKSFLNEDSKEPETLTRQFRLIPYHAVGKSGILPAFRPDSAIVISEGKNYDVMPVYIAVSRENIGGTEYSALINPSALARGRKRAAHV